MTERVVPAVHGLQAVAPDPPDELEASERLRRARSKADLLALFSRCSSLDTEDDARMRRVTLRALVKRLGHGAQIGRGVLVKHPETFEIGDAFFLGDQAILQGRHDGTCVIGSHVWLGPQTFFDARDLTIGDYVGWGPGGKVLGSQHTGAPVDVPITRTDLVIRPIRIGPWVDVGVNSVVLPGVTVGQGAIIGAGAVLTRDVPPFAIVAGVPARFIRWRDGHVPRPGGENA